MPHYESGQDGRQTESRDSAESSRGASPRTTGAGTQIEGGSYRLLRRNMQRPDVFFLRLLILDMMIQCTTCLE